MFVKELVLIQRETWEMFSLLFRKTGKVSGTTVVVEGTQSLVLDKVFLRNYFL